MCKIWDHGVVLDHPAVFQTMSTASMATAGRTHINTFPVLYAAGIICCEGKAGLPDLLRMGMGTAALIGDVLAVSK